jgi:glucose repression regulatory protein TUP1
LAPPESSSSAIPNPPSTPVAEIKSKEPNWSVSHNPGIKPALDIDLVKTIDFTDDVYCVKFSPDGKYLAVGLHWSGRTNIYDVEKGLKIWLAPSCIMADLS